MIQWFLSQTCCCITTSPKILIAGLIISVMPHFHIALCWYASSLISIWTSVNLVNLSTSLSPWVISPVFASIKLHVHTKTKEISFSHVLCWCFCTSMKKLSVHPSWRTQKLWETKRSWWWNSDLGHSTWTPSNGYKLISNKLNKMNQPSFWLAADVHPSCFSADDIIVSKLFANIQSFFQLDGSFTWIFSVDN